jgi:serine/threonine protein kinase
METRKGSFGTVTIDKLARTVTKKQPMYDSSRALDLCTLTDCVISAFVAATDSVGLPGLDDVRVLRDKHTVEMDMPYYGASLHDWIRNTPRLQRISMLPNIIFQLVDACAHLLDNDLQHTDIKPANILIDEFGKLTLIDFNIYSVRTISGWVDSVGTWCYVAPEILHKDRPHTNSMVWSIGLIIAEICCGYPLGAVEKLTSNINDRRQWQSLMRRMEKNHKSGLPMSTAHCACMPTHYVKLYNQCTRWNPEERPTINELLQQSATMQSKSKAICFTVAPSRSIRRSEVIDAINAFCTSHKNLYALIYRSIWLFDSYDHDDEHSIAGCISLAYTMIGFTVDDGFINGLNAHVTRTHHVRAVDIEDAMLNICVTLDWQLYDKAADMIVLSAGLKQREIIGGLPIVMKTLNSPYDGLVVAEALFKECCDKHKEEGGEERDGYADIGRNKHFSGIRRCEPRNTCMATYDEALVENKASA